MPIAIVDSIQEYRYRRTETSTNQSRSVRLSDALQAYAEDLLATGDVKLALERAFRWGFDDAQADKVEGLQERLQNLRSRRDRLEQEVDAADSLSRLERELDRIDPLDLASRSASDSCEEAVESESESWTGSQDQGAEQNRRPSQADQARSDLEELIGRLRSSTGNLDHPDSTSNSSSRAPQEDQKPRSRSSLDSPQGRAAQARRTTQLLFHGGVPADGVESSNAQWRYKRSFDDTFEGEHHAIGEDIHRLLELDWHRSAVAGLERVGSVMDLGDSSFEELIDMLDAADSAWLRDWRQVATAASRMHADSKRGRGPAIPTEVASAIGRDLLQGLFSQLSSPMIGEHQSMQRGNAGDPAEETVAWEFGRTLDLNLVSTVGNAVRRSGKMRNKRIRLSAEDFEVIERTQNTSVSTVMAIDRSRSMGQSDAWVAAKKVAMSMNELIRQSYPRDSLSLVAFSSGAEPVAFEDLPILDWDQFEHGTHLQAALEMSRLLHRQSRAGTKQIVIITDGEPTLATVSGEELFSSPPNHVVTGETLSEVHRCTREGLVINFVVLGNTPMSSAFVTSAARINRGRVFSATNDDLGFTILRDYVSH